MFRRWSLAAASAVAAACLLLCPQPASAQFRVVFGTGPIVNRPLYLSPSYVAPSYRTSFLYYQVGLPYNPVVTNPFLYRDPVTPVAYSLAPGVVPGSLAANGLGSYFARPFGYYGYGSYMPPLSYAPYLGYGYPAYSMPFLNYPGYPSYTYPSFYPGGLPYFSATGVNFVGYTDDLAGAYGAGLTTTPFVPGLTAPTSYFSGVPRLRTTITFPAAKPEGGGEVPPDKTPPRARASLAPAVALRPAATFTEVSTTAEDTVRIEVMVPAADAEVLFEGRKTTQTGKVRQFVSPPLEAGTYTYQIRCRWMRDGQPAEATQTIQVRPGQRRLVDFTTK